MLAAFEKAYGQRRRMSGFENQMALPIKHRRLLLCRLSPQQKHNAVATAIDDIDNFVRESLPTRVFMR